MRIELRVDPSRLRRWQLDLAARLEREGVGTVTGLRLGRSSPLPSCVELLLSLERLVHRLPAPRSSDRVDPSQAVFDTGDPADWVIDFCSLEDAGHNGRAIRPLYDGVPDESALLAALLDGRVPMVEIADGNGTVLAQGLASTENAGSLCEAFEDVVARVASLLLIALRHPATSLSAPAPEARVSKASAPKASARRAVTSWTEVGAYAGRALSYAAVRQLYRLCFHAPHWKVGWRQVSDRDIWDTRDLSGPAWTVLPDPGSRFYADPFPVIWRGQTHVFVEDFDHRSQKGIISAIPFDSHGPTGPARPVLEEPWHLSYPFIIEHAGEIWMIPESSIDRTVRLYRGDPFPTRWVEEACLLTDIEASDATITRHAGRLWMFATVRDGAGSHSDMLSIFMADDLMGPWRPHPGNPVLVDSRSARPAGAMIRRGGRLWRPVQDCRNGYGTALGLAEVTRLDEERFEQTVRQVIRPGGHWPGRRLHTVNRAGSLECIDGSSHSPKLMRLP